MGGGVPLPQDSKGHHERFGKGHHKRFCWGADHHDNPVPQTGA